MEDAGVKIPDVVRLHLGCGRNIKEGYVNVDILELDPRAVVLDLLEFPWPWADETVDEIVMEHTFEHFDAAQRVDVINEMYRVMKPNAKAVITCPFWGSSRAYGDPTHLWPPICEWTWIYFDENWRIKEAPHVDRKIGGWGFDCNFEAGFGYRPSKFIANRSPEFQKQAYVHFREAADDIIATLTKRPRV